MDVTKRLMELDPTLTLHNEAEWDKPLNESKVGYTSFNDAGVETEVGEFLYAMVRVLKPVHVLETGTHVGIGAAYMGQALKDNGAGELRTVEFLPEIHLRAIGRIRQLELVDYVYPMLADVREIVPTVKWQLILLDTEPQTRFAELVKFYDYLDEGGYIFIHDLHRHMHQIPNEEHGFAWPFGEIPEKIKGLVRGGRLRPFHFPTPRGLTGFYKPHQEDYQWK